ncbi:NADH dehydrogenase (ubiquinone) B17 subunit [Bombus fervidus]|uniref:NADH dehydrogenase (ubiquinone) B17 subunit n=1 Tax=Bombus fervidus TaxID=203811 RepID=UPI003AB46428
MASSRSGGVKPMSIGGRLVNERERLIGMTEEERAWRIRYLKSQILAPEEPLNIKEYNRQLYNPLRRFYRAPLNAFQGLLTPLLGDKGAMVVRYVTAKCLMGIVMIYGTWYYFKYNTSNWTRQSGWAIRPTRETRMPGTKDYKGLEKPKSFATYGFENSPI